MNKNIFKINDYDRHFFLYAKGHYKLSDNLIEDLKKILAHRSCLEIQHITTEDIITVLADIAVDIILSFEKIKYDILSFIFDLNPKNAWMIGVEKENYSYDEAVIRKSLTILRLSTTTDIGTIEKSILPG